ncbi:hypothetical protein SCLCIDRAFT_1151687 [Scleroderma citrinum Foug A]|uniref:Uncharacterized protein n=1 Tax=Scleroderma citrinum Foug A TaxID=1036808 RepID=A0A0C3DFN6_9AGAM|nr:hypothetical protein SCLCIDRAFT_1151687 [Scleroderma citrinum Foug A]
MIRSATLELSRSNIVFRLAQSNSYKTEIGPGYAELVYSATGFVPYILSLTLNSLDTLFGAISEMQHARGVRVVGRTDLQPLLLLADSS